VTGTAPNYRIATTQKCLPPLTGRFQRALLRSKFDQFMSFAKFHLIEAILPGT
jgi:hypothetical protein